MHWLRTYLISIQAYSSISTNTAEMANCSDEHPSFHPQYHGMTSWYQPPVSLHSKIVQTWNHLLFDYRQATSKFFSRIAINPQENKSCHISKNNLYLLINDSVFCEKVKASGPHSFDTFWPSEHFPIHTRQWTFFISTSSILPFSTHF